MRSKRREARDKFLPDSSRKEFSIFAVRAFDCSRAPLIKGAVVVEAPMTRL